MVTEDTDPGRDWTSAPYVIIGGGAWFSTDTGHSYRWRQIGGFSGSQADEELASIAERLGVPIVPARLVTEDEWAERLTLVAPEDPAYISAMPDPGAAFGRHLAAHDAEVERRAAERALREAADEFAVVQHPYEGGVTSWLRDRADRLTEEDR